ncbi:hypothetical protein, unlikely [Trypanosoma brucei gambiense DAL972]|uniref:Uncharacterized protein n=1 Tax=Trypanosoma brucei gambiense (strain MHOM/CI/86/DAL972) TaxID=679716 RepID=C9ZRN8_TRYB9|nr:hypothetical protein, unlikely [Trypanosoma brucei gambiense DAL972]CBH12024.1 hypothetical protein, unlikely [Trypanosoma brucei gambiense DAL972]|eukprot:XP_011774307.1 hypothetical protein, unlikely [Trypanosoma brucei gambiense DAL972]
MGSTTLFHSNSQFFFKKGKMKTKQCRNAHFTPNGITTFQLCSAQQQSIFLVKCVSRMTQTYMSTPMLICIASKSVIASQKIFNSSCGQCGNLIMSLIKSTNMLNPSQLSSSP